MSDHLLIVRLAGDFYTKARRTRMRFFRRLQANAEAALGLHGIPYRLEPTWSRIYVETPEPGAAEVLARGFGGQSGSEVGRRPGETLGEVGGAEVLARVFGVQSVSEVERRPWKTLEDVVATGVEIFGPAVQDRSFAVR